MQRTTLKLLRCPRCGSGPLKAEGETPSLRYGPVTCESCHAVYPVADGILDFLASPRETQEKGSLANRALQRAAVARFYERGLRPLLARFPLDPESELCLLHALLDPQRDRPILDLSCGTGHLARALAAREGLGPVIGIDSSTAMLREARHQVGETRTRVELIRADAHRLPLDDASMGGILNAASFHLYEEPLQVLEEAARVLEPGGRMVCTTFLPSKPRTVDKLEAHLGIHRRGADELRHLFELAGFHSFERILLPRWIVARATR